MVEGGREFVKMEGAGNDLILMDARERPLAEPEAELARSACDRRTGVGGDGLMLLERSPTAEALARMFNPDGTEDFCGNGMRCVAAWLRPEGGDVVIESPRGTHRAQVVARGAGAYDVTVELVTPCFTAEGIPARLPPEGALGYRLAVDGSQWTASSVSVGTTHTVVFLDGPLSDPAFEDFSPRIEHHPMFPERTSVLWCVARSSGMVDMRIWERGVGETMACGTGTCAVAVVGRSLGRTADRVTVRTAGGTMSAACPGRGPVTLTGPARALFRGVLSSPPRPTG